MITAREAILAIYGTYRLLLRDENGLRHINASVQGFWNSYTAAVLIAPLFLIDIMSQYDRVPAADAEGSLGAYVFVRMAAYVLTWLAFPLAMYYIARFLDREHNFLRFMVAYNWAAVIQGSIFFPISIVLGFGILPEGLASFIGLVVAIGLLIYAWYIARVGLDVDGWVATSVVIWDLALGFAIEAISGALF